MFNQLLAAMDSGNTVDILTVLDTSSSQRDVIGQMALLYQDGSSVSRLPEEVVRPLLETVRAAIWNKPEQLLVDNGQGEWYRVFWDRLERPLRAIVFGGGHISQPLVRILSLLKYQVTVIDDRPDFANRARFPEAHGVICESFRNSFQTLAIDDNTAVIIVTRGHRYDMDCLRATMNSSARYLGMIGSRKRVRETLELLRTEGAAPGLVQRLRAPIGLTIGAETPEEIAVSIAAEVIAVFRGGTGQPLSDAGRCQRGPDTVSGDL